MARRLMISGALGSLPWFGGHAWAYLNYILGFRRLGLDVHYVEYMQNEHCVDENGKSSPFYTCSNVEYFRRVMDRFGLSGCTTLLEQHGEGHVGLSHVDLERLAPEIDLLINIGGRALPQSIRAAVGRRIYIDLDPGYTQVWKERYGAHMNLDGYDLYVTVGLNIGKPECPLPTCGLKWETTLPPVVLDQWSTAQPPGASYTTVAEWRGFSPIEWRGVWYGQKAGEFLRLIDLPGRVSAPLELCLYVYPEEPNPPKLEEHGWHVVNPRNHTTTPDSYRDYIAHSRGEFTAVKHTYAFGRTGWFSDRSACYLAAGRPVIVQDTGIGTYLPTGAGLLTFTDVDSAAEAINHVESDYLQHAAAAESFAHEFLDSDLVLGRLLRLAGI